MEQDLVDWCAVIFLANVFPASFYQKNRNFWIFSKQIWNSLLLTAFLELWRSFSTNAFNGPVCFLLSCTSNVVIDRGREVGWRVFDKNNWKPRFFQRASVTLSHFSGLTSHVWHHCWLEDWIWSDSCFQFIADTFLSFHITLTDIFCAKNIFLHYLKLSAFSVPQSDAYYLNQKTVSAICTAVSCDASFDCERIFLMDLLPEIVKKCFLDLCRFFQKLFIPLHK